MTAYQELIATIAQKSRAIAAKDSDILYRQAKIDKLTHELTTLKRWKFGRSSELLNADQISLLDETVLIRLSQTPTRCSGSGFDGVQLGIGRRGDVAGDAEQ